MHLIDGKAFALGELLDRMRQGGLELERGKTRRRPVRIALRRPTGVDAALFDRGFGVLAVGASLVGTNPVDEFETGGLADIGGQRARAVEPALAIGPDGRDENVLHHVIPIGSEVVRTPLGEVARDESCEARVGGSIPLDRAIDDGVPVDGSRRRGRWFSVRHGRKHNRCTFPRWRVAGAASVSAPSASRLDRPYHDHVVSESPSSPDRLSAWLAEFRRRRVFRVTGAYVLVAWVLMQAGEIVFPAFELPNSALRVLIVALIAGLPCVIVLAWFLEVTPTGIRLTRRLASSLTEPHVPDPGRERSAASGDADPGSSKSSQGADSPSPPADAATRGRPSQGMLSLEILLLGIVVPLFAFAILLGYFTMGMDAPAVDTKSRVAPPAAAVTPARSTARSLAVLPFEDMSAAGSDGGFFARGMHEDILTHLARVESLKLISRTSVMGYEGTTKNLRQIGQELGVDHILEGSVRRTATQVRVTAQLIRAETDEHLWARHFDAGLEDVFAVQTQIADAIALALETELAPAKEGPTEEVVPAAYDAYLKARDLHRNLDAEDREARERVRRLYETALQADPRLAAAHLHLGILHAESKWFGFDRAGVSEGLARRNLASAIRTGIPSDQHALAEGVLAYYLDRDFGKALLHLEEASRRAPSSAESTFYRAMILRRMGQLGPAIEAQRAALDLDPLNLAYRDELALSLAFAGRLEEARSELIDLLRVDPGRSRAQLQKWQLDLELDGQPDVVFEEMVALADSHWQDPQYSFLETISVLAGRSEEALALLNSRPLTHSDGGFRDYQRAVLEGARGNAAAQKGWLDRSWKKFLAQRDHGSEGNGEEQRAKGVEALLLAQSGDYEKALALQEAVVKRRPIERDLVEGAPPLWQLLDLQLRAGRTDSARQTLQRLEKHVAIGSILNGGYFVLSAWPAYADVRADSHWAEHLEVVLPDYAKAWP